MKLDFKFVETDGIPANNRYILFINKGGKTGYGLTGYLRHILDSNNKRVYDINDGFIETGYGSMACSCIKDLYAYAYIDIPEQVWSTIPKQNLFKKSLLYKYLSRKKRVGVKGA